jgi:hypothetical protein
MWDPIGKQLAPGDHELDGKKAAFNQLGPNLLWRAKRILLFFPLFEC